MEISLRIIFLDFLAVLEMVTTAILLGGGLVKGLSSALAYSLAG